jgi:hypothetical protein
VPEVVVDTAGDAKQLLVRALLGNTTVLENDDDVCRDVSVVVSLAPLRTMKHKTRWSVLCLRLALPLFL